MNDLLNFLEEKLPKVVKPSKEYIELKTQEDNLAKQKRFKEASIIQKKREIQEKLDIERFNKEKTEKVKAQSLKTAHKQYVEKMALKKKFEIEGEVMRKEMNAILENIEHKYQNRKIDLDLQQKQAKLLYENENMMKSNIRFKFNFRKFG